ncbi:hypothetical protein [uncultured Draconibacterium sp.]|uniref:hypothetical protein n=1 Tax=uncultured Draconibacterium sp. TaxID=1573823 RepID=UPI0029C908CE|nr:hypothetical protein [uncultured Draconibacterium sp.]
MKTIKILFICMIASIFAYAQENVPPHMMGDVEVMPPKFTAVKYTADDANSLKNYIAQRFANQTESEQVREGTQVVQFVVNTDGTVSNIHTVNSVSPTIDNLITGILEETDYMWKPGQNNGVPVAMEKEIAIQIKVGPTSTSADRRDFTEIAKGHFSKGAEKLFVDGKTKKAVRYFESAIRYKPYDQATLYMLTICELDRGNSQKAQAYIDRFKKQGGNLDILEENLAQKVKSMEAYDELSQLFANN